MSLLDYLQKHYSLSSISSYSHRIGCYKCYNRSHEQGGLQEILNYLEVLRKEGKHVKTLSNYLHSIKIYYDYLQSIGMRTDHPCKKLQLKDKVDKRIKLLGLYSEEDLADYLKSTVSHKKLLVSFLVYQGLRVSELVVLKVSQIDLELGVLNLLDRVLPLEAVQVPLLISSLSEKGLDDYIFTTKNGSIYKASDVNGYINTSRDEVSQMTPLKMRQSVIRNLLYKNDIRLVQVFAGHKSSSTTAQYQGNNLEVLKRSVQENHPLQKF